MAYTKQNFENGQILTAEQLNHMEQGIAAPDWNDVINKPFTTVGGDTLTWDGNTEGLETFDGMYKVADDVVTMDMLSQGVIITFNGQTVDAADYLYDTGNGAIMFDVGMFLSVDMDDPESGTTLPKGIYLTQGVSSLTINGYTGFVKEQIKPEALPDGIGAQSDWNQNDKTAPDYIKNKPFHDVEPWIPPVTLPEPGAERMEILGHMISASATDKVCWLKENTRYVVNLNGTDYECVSFTYPYNPQFNGNVYLGNLSIQLTHTDNNGIPFLLVSNTNLSPARTQVMLEDESIASCTISIRIAADPTAKRIDPKYLPLGTPCITDVPDGEMVPAQYTYDGKCGVDGLRYTIPHGDGGVALERISTWPPEYFGDDWDNHPIGSAVEITEFAYDWTESQGEFLSSHKVLTNISIDSVEPVEGENGGYLVLFYSNTELVNREAWRYAAGQPFLIGAFCYAPDAFNGVYLPQGVYLHVTENERRFPSADGSHSRHDGYVSFLSVLDSETYPEIKANRLYEGSVPALPFIKLYDSYGDVYSLAVVEGELKLYFSGYGPTTL